jgi:hypothetical protein
MSEIMEKMLDGPLTTLKAINTHKVEGQRRNVNVLAVESYDKGGTEYAILGDGVVTTLVFQHGPIPQTGLNGVTNEALLAIIADRLERFQQGEFPCQENESALHHTKMALDRLRARTKNRIERGVEGKHEQ